jgi:hypothetical protein
MLYRRLQPKGEGVMAHSPPFSLYLNAELYNEYTGMEAAGLVPMSVPDIQAGEGRYLLSDMTVPCGLWQRGKTPRQQLDQVAKLTEQIHQVISLQTVYVNGLEGKLERGELWGGDNPPKSFIAVCHPNRVSLVVPDQWLSYTMDKIQRIMTEARGVIGKIEPIDFKPIGMGLVVDNKTEYAPGESADFGFKYPKSSVKMGDIELEFGMDSFELVQAKRVTGYIYQMALAKAMESTAHAFAPPSTMSKIKSEKADDIWISLAAYTLGAYGGFTNKDPPQAELRSAADIAEKVYPHIVSGFSSTYSTIHMYSGMEYGELTSDENMKLINQRLSSILVERIIAAMGIWRVGGWSGKGVIVNPSLEHHSIKEVTPYFLREDYTMSGGSTYPFLLPAHNLQTDRSIGLPMFIKDGTMEWKFKEAPMKGDFRQIKVTGGRTPVEPSEKQASNYVLHVERDGVVSTAVARFRRYRVFTWPEITQFGTPTAIRDPFVVALLMHTDGVNVPNKTLKAADNWIEYYNERVRSPEPGWFSGTVRGVRDDTKLEGGQLKHGTKPVESDKVAPVPGAPAPRSAVGDQLSREEEKVVADAPETGEAEPDKGGKRRGKKAPSRPSASTDE